MLLHTPQIRLYLFLSLFFLSFIGESSAQNYFCNSSEPFCTDEAFTYAAGVNTGQAEPGPNYGCLADQPNPAWFHMRIGIPGDINILMQSTPAVDIDFICWGPFPDPYTPCSGQLTSSAIVDCSYSGAATENCFIPSTLIGEYYILLINNWSNQSCDITFSKSSGDGESDCNIINPSATNNSPVCIGETLELYTEFIEDATYEWTGPDAFSSSLQNPIITNAQLLNGGLYSVVVTLNGVPSNPATTNAVIASTPIFEITNMAGDIQDTFRLCHGEQMKFKVNYWDYVGATWSNGNTGVLSGNINTSGDVWVESFNPTGCMGRDTTYLEVRDEINIGFNLPNFCQGD
ncbi:MAG: hypothetical protein B7C24_16305, partial [Bacteroidetes bacterium 4572_77]